MSETILCDEGLRVTVGGGGDKALVVVTDGDPTRFWTETSVLEALLDGGALQLSAPGGYCSIEIDGPVANLRFGLDGEGSKFCSFPTELLGGALTAVRATATPEPGDPT